MNGIRFVYNSVTCRKFHFSLILVCFIMKAVLTKAAFNFF
jgi:hypothetical protein